MLRPLVATAVLGLATVTSLPQPAPLAARDYRAMDDIHWTYTQSPEAGWREAQVVFTRTDRRGLFSTSRLGEFLDSEALAALASPGASISFAVAREAGTLACHGTVTAPQRASGTCRLDPDQGFAARFEAKGIAPEDDDEMLAATLVDAKAAQVEELERAGYRFGEFGDVIAVAALEVTAGFAASLRDAGLRLDELDDLVGAKAVDLTPAYLAELRAAGMALDDASEDDLVAARAVGVDREWLSGMAAVGRANLSLDDAVQLRALDVTPEYVTKMDRVLAAVGE
ncbi:hypothetical protein [Tsuneonella sp. HG222]